MSALDQMYQQVILDHAKFPHGRGLPEGEEGATAVAVAPHPGCGISHQVNPTCGDEITLRVDVSRAGGVAVVDDVRWEGQGCSITTSGFWAVAPESR